MRRKIYSSKKDIILLIVRSSLGGLHVFLIYISVMTSLSKATFGVWVYTCTQIILLIVHYG